MIQIVEVARLRVEKEEAAPVTLEDALAKARLDFKKKGVALRAALMQFPLDQEVFDDAYAMWKQAQATMKAIEAAMVARLTCAAFTGTACGRPIWNRHRDNDVVNRGRREERRTGVGQQRFSARQKSNRNAISHAGAVPRLLTQPATNRHILLAGARCERHATNRTSERAS